MTETLFILISLGSLVALAGVIYPFLPFKKRWKALLTFVFCLLSLAMIEPQPNSHSNDELSQSSDGPSQGMVQAAFSDDGLYWVVSERLNRRTCPSTDCGVVGQLFFREGVEVLERRDGWVRITDYYDGSCVSGRSEYLDLGNNRCIAENGFSDGTFAEWVSEQFLSSDRPPNPAGEAVGIEILVGGSDDFLRYRNEFVQAAQTLIAEGTCSEADFHEMGGWVKSSAHREQPIYFTYCGGSTLSARLYLDAETGDVFR